MFSSMFRMLIKFMRGTNCYRRVDTALLTSIFLINNFATAENDTEFYHFIILRSVYTNSECDD